jgi:hypothetical protein
MGNQDRVMKSPMITADDKALIRRNVFQPLIDHVKGDSHIDIGDEFGEGIKSVHG